MAARAPSTGVEHGLPHEPSMTEVFLIDKHMTDNPSDGESGGWQRVPRVAACTANRPAKAVMSTLRKHGRPPDHRKAKPKVNFEVGAQPQVKRKAKGRKDASEPQPNLDPKYVLDICSGYQSLAKYYLREFPRCKVISIDLMDEEHALATLTAVERERVSYHKFDVTNLTFEELEGILWKAYRIGVKDLTHLHWSPMCSTMSSADLGSNGYRAADGTAVPGTLAEEHDKIFNRVMHTVRGIARTFPNLLLTAENPSTGVFWMQPQVKAALAENIGWQLLNTDYCKAADIELDKDVVFSQKPTHILVRGVPPGTTLPQCNKDCNARLSGQYSHRHKKAVRIDHRSAPGQTRLLGWQRDAIPKGLFKAIWNHHLEYHTASEHSTIRRWESRLVNAKSVESETLKTRRRWWALLHARYGHASMKRLRTVKHFKGLQKLKLSELPCETCHASKAVKRKHAGHLKRATYPLGLVHTDIQGPFREKDLDGNWYQMILVDDFTRRKWLFRLKSKDEYPLRLKQWIAMMGLPPDRMRSDFGGEFLGEFMNGFLQVCAERGIHPEKSLPGESEQNGVAERANRTLLEMARSMMLGAGLPKRCWGHAMMHAAHIDEFLGTSANSTDSPHSLWYGAHEDPDFKVFGSAVWFVHNEDRGKLDPPGHKGVYLGHCEHTDGIYVWDRENPNEPVRLSRNYLGKSFHEHCAVQTEPIGVSADSFELLKDEIEQLEANSYLTEEAQSLPYREPDNVPVERLQHWKDLARFVRDRREKYAQHYDLSPAEAEERVKQEWKLRELRRYESAAHARTLEQRLQQTREAVEALKEADTESSGGTVAPPAKAKPLKRVRLIEEPARKKRKTGYVSEKTSADDEPELEPMFEPDHVVSPPTTKAAPKSNDDIMSQASTQPSGSQSSSKRKQAAPSEKLSESPTRELRRSKRTKGNVESMGSETPAERSKRRKEEKEPPDKYTPCKVCEKWECDNVSNQMLICEECNGYFHRNCISARHMPKKAWKWLCHSCVKEGLLVDVMRKDQRWHKAVVLNQHQAEVGTELLFDNGETDLLDLNTQRWRPHMVSSLRWLCSASEELEDAARGMVGIPVIKEPKTFNSLKLLPPSEQAKWRRSMEQEWQSLCDKGVMHTVARDRIDPGTRIVPLKWVYKIKSCGRYKSRLVALGNLMDDDKMDTESPTPSMTVVRALFSLAAKRAWDVQLIDVDTAFLNAAPNETVYVSLPQGYSEPGKVALLLKSLYGTSNAPKSWNTLLHNWMLMNGFKANPHEPCLYTGMGKDGSVLHLLVHVDDVAIFSSTDNCVAFKELLRKTFECKDEWKADDVDKPKRYLGFDVKRTSEGFVFCQSDLINKLATRAGRCRGNTPNRITPIRSKPKLEKYPQTPGDRLGMKNYPFRSHLGVTGYVTVGTRPDSAYAYKTLASFNDCHGPLHRDALQDFISYLAVTADTHTLKLGKGGGDQIVAYCDADWNGTECHRSTTGWIIFHGDNPISWASRTQKCTARSTGEAEYIALSSLCQEAIYIKMLLESLDEQPGMVRVLSNEGTEQDPGCVSIWQRDNKTSSPMKVWSDSLNAVQNSRKEWVSDKLRHIKTAYHFFKQYVKSGDIDLQHISGLANCADIFTKGYGEGAPGSPNQMAEAFRQHALRCLGHRNCASDCTCQKLPTLEKKVGDKRKAGDAISQQADVREHIKQARQAHQFREAPAVATLRKAPPVGEPNIHEIWSEAELFLVGE